MCKLSSVVGQIAIEAHARVAFARTDVDVDPTALSLRALVNSAAIVIKECVATTAGTGKTTPLRPVKLSTGRVCGVVRIIEIRPVRTTA